jgi:hypothetical protein
MEREVTVIVTEWAMQCTQILSHKYCHRPRIVTTKLTQYDRYYARENNNKPSGKVIPKMLVSLTISSRPAEMVWKKSTKFQSSEFTPAPPNLLARILLNLPPPRSARVVLRHSNLLLLFLPPDSISAIISPTSLSRNGPKAVIVAGALEGKRLRRIPPDVKGLSGPLCSFFSRSNVAPLTSIFKDFRRLTEWLFFSFSFLRPASSTRLGCCFW